jgi:hypothetical protein
MSLIHTCKPNRVNPFHHLSTLKKYKSKAISSFLADTLVIAAGKHYLK